jgi:hypothetical protein
LQGHGGLPFRLIAKNNIKIKGNDKDHLSVFVDPNERLEMLNDWE